MRVFVVMIALSFLAACGVETATTAAASAEIKRREMEQAKQTMEHAKQKIEQNTQQILQRAAQSEEKSKE